jgi:hypothetical protein
MAQTIAACDALAAELRKVLKADALFEYEAQGMAPTWRLPGYTVSTSISHDAVVVVDEAAFLRYVRDRHPHQVETIHRPYPAWRGVFLGEVLGRGNPPCDADGRVVDGLAWVAGGEFRSVSVLPQPATKSALRAIAQDIVAGRRPLGLPETVEIYS